MMELFMLVKACGSLPRAHWVLERVGGGLFKRIDENRELLEVLETEAPELMAKRPWIRGWLRAQDEFLMALGECLPPPQPHFGPRPGFPRAWPADDKGGTP